LIKKLYTVRKITEVSKERGKKRQWLLVPGKFLIFFYNFKLSGVCRKSNILYLKGI
jgi:hypothetical protein